VSISDRLREEREKSGLSQEKFGQIGGVTKKTQLLYESGARTPDAAYLRAVAGIGVDVQYVLLGIRSQNLDDVMLSDEFVQETVREMGARPVFFVLSDDEAELIESFRSAPLAVKAAVIGALAAGVLPASKIKQKVSGAANQVAAGNVVNQNQGEVHVGGKSGGKRRR
jgi:transcriptional regulator with XRE-family HTH domain